MVALSHPTGNIFVRQTLELLQSTGDLSIFFTALGWSESAIKSYWPLSATRWLSRRAYDLPSSKIKIYPLIESVRLLAQTCLHKGVWGFSTDDLYRGFDKKVAQAIHKLQPLNLIYSYEDACCETFKEAKRLGVRCIYELPIAYWETVHQLLAQEALRYPQWEPTLGSTRDSPQKCQAKTQECELADAIVCPSAFVLNSLPTHIREKKTCILAPYGAPTAVLNSKPLRTYNDAPLKVLFVGSMTQRKGLADLFAAMKLLPQAMAELTVLGSPLMPLSFYKSQLSEFSYRSPRPHNEVLACMREHDVLVLPSIVEGRALVQLEALSCGLPLIVTPNTGADDLIVENQTGFCIPIRSPEHIAQKLLYLATNRSHLKFMSEQASIMAQKSDWSSFRKKILELIHE